MERITTRRENYYSDPGGLTELDDRALLSWSEYLFFLFRQGIINKQHNTSASSAV